MRPLTTTRPVPDELTRINDLEDERELLRRSGLTTAAKRERLATISAELSRLWAARRGRLATPRGQG